MASVSGLRLGDKCLSISSFDRHKVCPGGPSVSGVELCILDGAPLCTKHHRRDMHTDKWFTLEAETFPTGPTKLDLMRR